MSEENKQVNNENVTKTEENDSVNSSAVDVKTDETDKEQMIPYSRFKEVNDNYKALKAQLDDLTNQKTNEELEAKKQTGEFEDLYNSLQAENEPLKKQVDQYKQLFEGMLQTKLEQVPEQYQDLIPEGDDVSKLVWIESAISKGLFETNQTKSFGNKGNNPIPSSPITKEQFAKMSYSERVKLRQENKDLYDQLVKK